ncbi:MAG: hypothetical protein P8J33_04525, partial [Pirellulaceae bacterium]|nr:hypothetical protein [Pirellulaceae bacterium]
SDLPKGIYIAKVWLQWQHVYEDVKTGYWHTLAHPKPPIHGTGGEKNPNKNTHHLFVITPCDTETPNDVQDNN